MPKPFYYDCKRFLMNYMIEGQDTEFVIIDYFKDNLLYYYNTLFIYKMALIKEYFDITKKYKEDYGENSILLMMVGSFFEVYGILDKTTGVITGSKIVDFGRICDLNIFERKIDDDSLVFIFI